MARYAKGGVDEWLRLPASEIGLWSEAMKELKEETEKRHRE